MAYEVAKTNGNGGKVEILNRQINSDGIQEQFRKALGDSSDLFMASVVEIFASDNYLQQCDPGDVLRECLKAATLKLPINKMLGQAYILPYKGKPQFQIGYKGYIQLAQRTGKYRCINADVVFEGELKKQDKLTGEIDISGNPISGKVIGYFAHIETTNGFRKTLYWTRQRVEAHGKKYSQSFNSGASPWQTNFDAMGIKTVLKYLLSHYGELSIDMQIAMSSDADEVEAMPNFYANNGEVLDVNSATGEVLNPPKDIPVIESIKSTEVPF